MCSLDAQFVGGAASAEGGAGGGGVGVELHAMDALVLAEGEWSGTCSKLGVTKSVDKFKTAVRVSDAALSCFVLLVVCVRLRCWYCLRCSRCLTSAGTIVYIQIGLVINLERDYGAERQHIKDGSAERLPDLLLTGPKLNQSGIQEKVGMKCENLEFLQVIVTR